MLFTIIRYANHMQRVRIEHLNSMAEKLTRATGDRHFIEGCSGKWRLHRASDGECLHKGNGAYLLARMQSYLRAHLAQFGSADPHSVMFPRKR